MAVQIYLSQGDGATNNAIDLSTSVDRNTLESATPAEGERYRTATMGITLKGASTDNAWDQARAIQQMLYLARRNAGPYGVGSGVTLGVSFDTSEMVYFDIVDGSFDFREIVDGARRVLRGTLALTCLRYLRGDAVTADPTATLTNGAMTWVLDSVAGDAPAPCRITMTDESTGSAVINGLRIGAKSLPGMGSSDFDPIFDLAATGSGSDVADATAIDSTIVAITPTTTWADMAEAAIPGTAYSIGLYDLYLRMQDETTNISVPTTMGVSTSPITGAWATTGNLAAQSLAIQPGAGALLLGFIKTSGATVTVAPSGWTLVDSHSTTGVQTYIYEKIADGTETAFSFTLSSTPASNFCCLVLNVRGTSASSYRDKTVKSSGTGASATPSTTGTLAQAAEIAFIVTGRNTTADSNTTPPAGYTEQIDSNGLHVCWDVTGATTALNPTVTGAGGAEWVCHAVTYKIDLEGAATSSAPGLTNGSALSVRVAGLSVGGGVGQVSDTVLCNPTPTTGNLHAFARWTAPLSGAPSTYRVWWKQGASAWRYFDTDDSQPQYVILNNTLGTVGDPPATLASANHLLRASVALASGTSRFTTPSVVAERANSLDELLYVGTVPFPPAPLLDAGSAEDALLTVEAKAQAQTIAQIIVDAAYLFPHEEAQLYAYVDGYDLTTKRDWVLETRRDGVVTGRLYEDGTTTEAGQPVIDGAPFLIGPGLTRFVAHVETAAGASDVVDAKATFTVRYIPQFLTFRGAD